jgi:hypothetical protein
MKKQYYNQSRMRAVHHSGVKAFDNFIVSITPGNSIGGGLYGKSIRGIRPLRFFHRVRSRAFLVFDRGRPRRRAVVGRSG